MASFQGGKQRIGKQLSAKIQEIIELSDMEGKLYIEPFCGWCGVLRYMAKDGNLEIRAGDKNTSVVKMWKALQEGWRPPSSITKEEYMELKKSEEDSALRGFMGVACGFNGIFFGSFKYNSNYREDPIEHGLKHAVKIAEECKNVKFYEGRDYREWNPTNSVVYCDPPYVDTIEKRNKLFEFDSEEFWETMREWSDPDRGNLVLVSERKAPDDWKCIWENKRNHAYSGGRTKVLVENLYIRR